MQTGQHLEFECLGCNHPISFSVLEIASEPVDLHCKHCQRIYRFKEGDILRKLKMFEALCRQIHASEEILSHTSVSFDHGEKNIRLPYRLLLTRLKSILNLKIQDQEIQIAFRLEPAQEISALEISKEAKPEPTLFKTKIG